MAEDGRLSDAGARALLVEVALQNREVVAAVRDADEERLEALALKIKEINACQDHLRLFTCALAATVPSDGGAAIGLGRYVEDDAYDLDDFEALRGGTTALQSDEDYSEEESDDDDDDDAEWPPAWRYPRETFQDDGAIPPGGALAASGHRRVSISLNAAQLLAIAQSRKRNSRARARGASSTATTRTGAAWLADMEKAASVEAYAAHWRTTARSRAEARRVEAT
ncbi:hypothetical protein JL722_14791 [Aureococcus anophagefferens]|nr:hypothetical protein JL722_14791 [Aureococcus anophagefferens]